MLHEGPTRQLRFNLQSNAGGSSSPVGSADHLFIDNDRLKAQVRALEKENQELRRRTRNKDVPGGGSRDGQSDRPHVPEEERLHHTLLELLPEPVLFTGLRSHLLYINPAGAQLLGHDSSENLVGTPISRYVHADDRRAMLLRARKLLRGDPVERARLRFVRTDGAIITVETESVPMQYRGRPAVLSVARDLTMAQEVARMRSAFLTNMTHEIRTPLTAILGFTTMLRQGVRPEYRRFVHVIERSGNRLLLTLDSILDLAQLEAGTLEVERSPFKLEEAVDGVMESIKPLLSQKGITLEYARPEEPLYAAGGHRIVNRIVRHLLDNAVKFTDSGSIQVSAGARDELVYVTITDTGIGIRDEFLDRIFEEFSQESTGLERTHQGAGLGLAVSNRLARVLRGSIEVRSEKGRGSSFTLNLPQARPPKAHG